MAKTAKVTLHPDYQIDQVDKRVYSAFLEPIGSWVYGGIWNPKHPTADDLGFRQDIIDAVKEFDLPALRFPGGNWISGWDWKKSIGPVEERQCQLDLAWRQYEPNLVGHDEYIEWCKRIGAEAMYTINTNSEDLKSAFHLVEYCNHPGGTYWSDLRKKYGHNDPYDIRTWCLGNETDGLWQIASWEKDPVGYGIRTHEISKVIKWIDNKSETVVAGSCSPFNKTYPTWDMQVLEQCYETVDYVSLHHYHTVPEGDLGNFLNSTSSYDDFIKTTIATCDYLQSKLHSPKKINISFDEYGSSFKAQRPIEYGRGGRIVPSIANTEFLPEVMARPFKWNDPDNYEVRRPNNNQQLSALSMASTIMTFIRHADRVKIGVMTGGVRGAVAFDGNTVWKSATYYPYYHMNKYGRGTSILPVVDGPTFNTKQFNLDTRVQYHDYYDVQSIDVACVHDEEKEEVAVFMVNRDLEDNVDVTIDMRGFEGYKLIEHLEMFTDDLTKGNSPETPDAIKPVANTDTKLDGGKLSVMTKKFSWNLIRLGKK